MIQIRGIQIWQNFSPGRCAISNALFYSLSLLRSILHAFPRVKRSEIRLLHDRVIADPHAIFVIHIVERRVNGEFERRRKIMNRKVV